MIKHFKFIVYLYVFTAINIAKADDAVDFFRAIKANNVSGINALLKRGFNPNSTDPQGQYWLLFAIREEAYKAAEALLDAKTINVEVRTGRDENPLMMACLVGHLGLVKKMLTMNADVNKTGWAPLHYAAAGGNAAVVKELLEHHAYVDAESPDGTTPLMMAARDGSEDAVKALLEADADPTIKNKLGFNAIEFGEESKRPFIVKLLQQATQAWQNKPKTPSQDGPDTVEIYEPIKRP